MVDFRNNLDVKNHQSNDHMCFNTSKNNSKELDPLIMQDDENKMYQSKSKLQHSSVNVNDEILSSEQLEVDS